MFWIIFLPFAALAAAAGIIYPAGAVIWYKLKDRRLTVREILEVIGW